MKFNYWENSILWLQKLHTDYARLEDAITKISSYISKSLTRKIDENLDRITSVVAENRSLRKENASIKDCISWIETSQMKNNIIVSGVAETRWEPYETTKTRVHEMITLIMSTGDPSVAMAEAMKVEILCCSRIGRFQMNQAHPISVTLLKYDDKENMAHPPI